jgi:glycosyltransferase involved in cell wall biosynthesis
MPEAEFIIYEPRDCSIGKWFDGAANVSVQRTSLPSVGRIQRFLEGLQYWNKALSNQQFNFFEVANLPLIKAPSGRTLLTIHDIRGTHFGSGLFERAAYSVFFEKSLKTADHVITVSEAMRDEILTLYPSLQISVIYNGLDANIYDQVFENDMAEVRIKYELPDEFILAVGHFEKRKNYLRLIEAISLLRDRGRPSNLIIVGNNSGERQKIIELVQSKGLSSYVTLLSGLSDLEVRCFYKLCQLFVFPSSYEGFGIPILEAMAAKCPMVLSDIPVFREITQNMGVYFPHDNVELMATAIEEVLSSSNDRKRLIDYGNKRVRDFSFNSLAAQVENLYRSFM